MKFLAYSFAALALTHYLSAAVAQTSDGSSAYKLIAKNKVGGEGGFDYVYADSVGRKLYVPRPAKPGHIMVFNLDTFEKAGELDNINARGVAVDPNSHHGFSSSKPIAMWDTQTLTLIKTIDVEGGPDGIFFDPFNARVWVFSHRAPNATVIDAKSGTIVGTLDLGGEPEQAVSDGHGRVYVDIENKDKIAVVDAEHLKVTGYYDLSGKGGGPGGLAFDQENHVLFATCHEPAVMVALNSDNGKILNVLPIGQGTDGALFNPATKEAFSSNGRDGTLSIIKEISPTEFSVEQTLPTMAGARTSTLDPKTGHVVLISAEYGPTPQPTPTDRWARRPMVPGSFSVLVVGR